MSPSSESPCAPTSGDAPSLARVPLDALHRSLGARMVPFAGYDMPVQYEGILAEHLHTRAACGLFDVSHMGQAFLKGERAVETLESLTPGSFKELKPGRQRYSLLLNAEGGILDDLMVVNLGVDTWFIVVNAARKAHDFALIAAHLQDGVTLEVLEDRALIAVQGPTAAEAVAHLAPASAAMRFMDAGTLEVAGIPCLASRSGYTGEDGFEISAPAAKVEHLARLFLALPGVKPIGLGARDSLRLEAGLPLYGSDIDETTTPVEAGLEFALGKRRKEEASFPGASPILDHLSKGSPRRRVGLALDGKAPARAHTEIQDTQGRRIGEITSGGYGPTVEAPIAMGFVESAFADPGTPVSLIVRGKPLSARVVDLPFVEHRYFRG